MLGIANIGGTPGYTLLELRRSLRDRRFLALVIGWPVGAYLLFSSVFGSNPANGSEGLDPKVEIMVAMAVFGAMGSVLIATGPRLGFERSTGWLRQLALTPMDRRSFVSSRVTGALLLAIPSIVVVFGVAFTVNGVRFALWQWLAMFGLIVLGCLPFAALGVAIGCLTQGESSMSLTMVVYIALSALGGIWIPTKILPAPMRTLAEALPSNGVATLGWRIAAGNAPTVQPILVIVAWFVGASLLALVAQRRLTIRR
jgi:ABC-2 type transport system permease protein